MQKRHELPNTHERMRLKRSQHILDLINEGMLPNLFLAMRKNLTFSNA